MPCHRINSFPLPLHNALKVLLMPFRPSPIPPCIWARNLVRPFPIWLTESAEHSLCDVIGLDLDKLLHFIWTSDFLGTAAAAALWAKTFRTGKGRANFGKNDYFRVILYIDQVWLNFCFVIGHSWVRVCLCENKSTGNMCLSRTCTFVSHVCVCVCVW